MREVAAELAAALASVEMKLAALLKDDLTALNALARESGVPFVVVPPSDGR
jgi:hypothetical protein